MLLYCDASYSAKDQICTWAIVVDHSREHRSPEVYTGEFPGCDSMQGEILVCLKAIRLAKDAGDKCPTIFTDYAVLHELSRRVGKNKFTDSRDYELIEQVAVYLRAHEVHIRKVEGKNNPAHKHAFAALTRLREQRWAEEEDEDAPDGAEEL